MNNTLLPLDIFYRWEKDVPSMVFLRQSLGTGEWLEYTWSETADRVRRLAAFLQNQQLSPGTRIGIWSANCADWIVADLAIMMSGHISVPIYPGQDMDSAHYIQRHSEMELIFLGAFDQMGQSDIAVLPDVHRVAIRGYEGHADYQLEDILQTTERMEDSPSHSPQALFTIIYSSGTTGNPKGVMHAYGTPAKLVGRALQSAKIEVADADFSGERNRLLSFLPLSHIAERLLVAFNGLYSNSTISFSAGLDSFPSEIQSVQPTFFFAVPRLWAKFKAGVDAKIPPAVQAQLDEQQRESIRKSLGLNQARFVLSSSAPLAPELQKWFLAMGICLREGYGMTETFGVGATFPADADPIPGCVGKGGDVSDVKISKEGEVWIKTDGLMVGYYKNLEATREVIEDGWYKTGDSGYVDDDGNLWVTGRLGSIFKTTKGKFIHPEHLEEQFGNLPELSQLLVFGHGMDQPALLASLSEYGQALAGNDLQQRLENSLKEINRNLPAHERISRIFVTTDEWTMESGLLTPTLKVKRKKTEQHFQALINSEASTIVWEQPIN